MKLDICSDTHWDFYSDANSATNFRKIEIVLEKTMGEPNCDTLVIAGDTGHYPSQDALFLTVLKERYKNIFIVLGNHNLYCVSKTQRSKYKTWQSKFDDCKKIYEGCDCIVLDGDTVELEGKKIGGAMGWYDGAFFYKNGFFTPYSESLEAKWRRVMNDSRLISSLDSFYEIFTIEIEKIRNAYKESPDLMVTHFIPSIENIAFSDIYANDPNNAFYSFDFLNSVSENVSKPMTWVYGHTHTPHEFYVQGVSCICNPIGYPRENPHSKLITIEI